MSARTRASSQPCQVDLRFRDVSLAVRLRLARGVFGCEGLGVVVSPHVAQVGLHGARYFTAQVCLGVRSTKQRVKLITLDPLDCERCRYLILKAQVEM